MNSIRKLTCISPTKQGVKVSIPPRKMTRFTLDNKSEYGRVILRTQLIMSPSLSSLRVGNIYPDSTISKIAICRSLLSQDMILFPRI